MAELVLAMCGLLAAVAARADAPKASLDLAPLCQAANAMAVTGKLSPVMTVKEISNGPKLPGGIDRKSTRLNSSHLRTSRMPSSA